MERRGSSLISNTLALYVVQGLGYLVTMLLLPYLLRTLGAIAFGVLVLAQSASAYVLLLTDYGYNLGAARDVAVNRGDALALSKIYWRTQFAKMWLFLSGLVLGAFVVFLVPALRIEWSVFLASAALAFGSVCFPQWYLQGLERLKSVAIIQASAKLVAAAMVVVFVHDPGDAWKAALALSSSTTLGAFFAAFFGIRLIPDRFYFPTMREVAVSLKENWHLFASGLATSVYLYANPLILGAISGPSAVAQYGLGQRLLLALQSLVSPVFQATFPRASALFSKDDRSGCDFVRRIAWLLGPVMLVLGGACMLFAPRLVTLIGGEAYVAAADILRIMSPIPLLIVAAMLLGQMIMINVGRSADLFLIYVRVGLLSLFVMPLLIYYWDARGAAVSLLLAEACGPFLMWMKLRAGLRPNQA